MTRVGWRSLASIAVLCVATGPMFAAEEPVEWSVDPGTGAVLIRDDRAPVVTLRVEFPAGRWSPWFRRGGAEEAFEIQLHDGDGVLRDRADRLGVTVLLYVQRRASVLEVACLREDLAPVANLVRDVLTHRDFDRRELRRRKQSARIAWDSLLKQPSFVAEQAIARLLYAAGDPRRLEWEKPPRIKTDVADLVTVRDRLVGLPGRLIGFAGDVTRDDAARFAAGLLPSLVEKLPSDLAPVFEKPSDPTRRAGETELELPRLTQIYLYFARESPAYAEAEHPAFIVANHVLGGHFYSRLNVALRHEGGDTYGARAGPFRGDVVRRPYAVSSYTRVANANAVEAKIERVLNTLREEGITDDERRAASGFLRGRIAFGRQSPDQQLRRFLWERIRGLEPGYLDRRTEEAARLPLEEINRFIGSYFDPDRFTRVRVVPEE